MKFTTTRRGLLRGTLGTALATTAGCRRELESELGSAPAVEPPHGGPQVSITTTVNGVARTAQVGVDTSASELLRDTLKLTGTKVSCGHGACGACTVQLDGVPVTTCILPATSLHGKAVTTVEALGQGGLHPVQRAFMAEDALQCGFCTPGFVVEAAAFHDKWRAEQGARAPTRDEIAAALAGHLCRCGAYENIYAAVAGACAGKFDKSPETGPRVDARAKVTGEARYTVDVQLPNQLVGKLLRSPHAHAQVKRLDWSKAVAAPGVHGVVELLGAQRTLRYVGQELVALAAVDEEAAARGLSLIEVEYEVKPAIIGLDAGLDPKALPVYPTRNTRKALPNANEAPLLPVRWSGNLRGPFQFLSKKRGAAERAVKRRREAPADGVALAATYETQVQCHTCLEPHACVADWRDDGLTVHLSTQAVHTMSEDIAQRWKLKHEAVQVLAPYVGGGFGSKATLTTETIAAVELSRLTKRPVMVALERREELAVGGNRPAQRTEIALASSASGELEGMTVRSYTDAGVAVGSAPSMLFRIMYADAPKHIEDWDVLTHAPPGKPLRAPGGPPAFWALEQTIDELAHHRGEDPIAVRRRFDPNPARAKLYAWASALPVWRGRRPPAQDKGRFRRGVGVAAAGWPYFVQPSTRVQLEVTAGGLVASTAAQDMGNGTRSVIAQAVADVFGVSPSSITVQLGDSRYVPGPMSGGSRTSASVYPAAYHAAIELREELVDFARGRFGIAGAVAAPGGLHHGGRTIPWADVFKAAPRLSTVGKRKRDKGGYFLPPIKDLAVGKYVSGGVHVTELEVDTRLGRIRVLGSWIGIGVGKIYVPKLARSQAIGGVTQAIGYALYEERRLDPRFGALLTGGLEDYRIPGIADIGEFEVYFMEDGFENVRSGGVGLGELVKLAPAAAIGNAVFNATGWRPRQLPIRPDRVLAGVKG
ncbi:MAG: molybdopterin-dependent oxidoreductase [Nannocystaceae bacterium]